MQKNPIDEAVEGASLEDLKFLYELDNASAARPASARQVDQWLCSGRLREGFRRLGLRSLQLRIGKLSILFVVSDPDHLRYVQKREQRLRRHRLIP